ncbi:uncharacterized protein LOC114306130 [Camellia sinensis]|uniref:uncharacterized protein LOC114306130 n=1 Tax=Camellia sinensis TaxID=4442 RepID=UPI001036D6DB|nr:uncharacterized protein LOC114306130 [Camellia sinensis]
MPDPSHVLDFQPIQLKDDLSYEEEATEIVDRKDQYAHYRCIQRWCNKKGDTVCEICHQPFKPGYTTPPPMFQLGSIPMNFRKNWEISRRDLNNPCFIAMVTTEPNFVDQDYDEYGGT